MTLAVEAGVVASVTPGSGLTEVERSRLIEDAIVELAEVLAPSEHRPALAAVVAAVRQRRALEAELRRAEQERGEQKQRDLDALHADAVRRQLSDLEKFNAERVELGLSPAKTYEEAVKMGNKMTNPRAWRKR